MSTSPGALGGIRGLVFLRMLLANIGVIVLPDQHAVPRAFKVFDEDGSLIDEQHLNSVLALGAKLVATVRKLNE